MNANQIIPFAEWLTQSSADQMVWDCWNCSGYRCNRYFNKWVMCQLCYQWLDLCFNWWPR